MKYQIIILFFILGFLSARARVIVVGKDKPVTTITAAIKMAVAGDTIQVMPGIYREGTILIQKPLTLLGIHYPVLDGQRQFQIVEIRGKDIRISGFVLKDSRHSSSEDFAAIQISASKNIIADQNQILNAHFGIHIANSTTCIIRRNHITGKAKSEQAAGNGIHIWKSDHIRLEDNHVSGHRDGIYFEFVTESEIEGNFSGYNLRYGLHFMFSNKDNYINNVFQHNGTGVAVMYTRDVRMVNNTFRDNWGTASYAMLLKDITDSYLEGNRFINNTVGIFMEGGNRIRVHRNLFQKNGWALKVQANCDEDDFSMNNFLGNTFDVSTNGTKTMSFFNRNYWDKYDGYDMNKDGFGDVPYHPVSLYSMIIEQNPDAAILLRSFMVALLEKAEKAMPALTPENLIDKQPLMKPLAL